MNNHTKQQIRKIICRLPFILRLVAYKTRNIPRIFMYHRFTADACDQGAVISAVNFDWQLQQLQGRWNVISLAEYVQFRRQKIKPPPYTVILTVDDGYRDFYDVAYPLLHKFHYPATFFVTTAFIDGDIWLWNDRLHFAIKQTQISGAELSLGNDTVKLLTSTQEERDATWQLLSDYCIDIPDEEKWRIIQLVEKLLKVDLPAIPPVDFAASSWEQLQEMTKNGIEIGGHTVTHPVLSQIEPDELYNELITPKEKIEKKTGKAVTTFCYPNGRDADVTAQVIKIIKNNEYLGAVQGSGIDFSNLYRLPRLGITNDRLDFLWKLSGFEQMFLKIVH